MDWRDLQSPIHCKKQFFPQSPPKIFEQSDYLEQSPPAKTIQKEDFQKLFQQYVKKTKKRNHSLQINEHGQLHSDIQEFQLKQLTKKNSQVQLMGVSSQKNKYFTLQMPEKTVPKTSSLIADGLLGIAESDFLRSKTIPNHKKPQENQNKEWQKVTAYLETLAIDMKFIKQCIKDNQRCYIFKLDQSHFSTQNSHPLKGDDHQEKRFSTSDVQNMGFQQQNQIICRQLKGVLNNYFNEDTSMLGSKIKDKQIQLKKFKNKLSNFFFENKLQHTQVE